ncbi:MAG TPA: DUF5658 family protein [Clostridium sp.]|uniref:DUF5658 family protein n=1 Tax=Clostridium sp. TaxID=1506 RepID=UPI002F94ABFE
MSFISSLVKTRDLDSIKKKLITIYILNGTDIIFTIFLVNTGMFIEVNAVMALLVNNRQLFTSIIGKGNPSSDIDERIQVNERCHRKAAIPVKHLYFMA